MTTRWETFPVELSGGLVSNLSRLQQGLKAPGSARVLQNFEPSIKGGYRRINGFDKYSSTGVPAFGEPKVQGSGQTGASVIIGNLHEAPDVGDTLTIGADTYTITSVSYTESSRSADLGITPDLTGATTDKDTVVFTAGSSRIEGVYFSASSSNTYVLRGGNLWKGTGTSWTLVNVPSHGTVLVNGGSQTGTSLIIEGLTSTPSIGDTFSIAGVELVYTVAAAPTVTSGTTTLTISPALDSSPADNAALTFLTSSHRGGTKARFVEFNFDGTTKTCMVDNSNYPSVFTSTTYKKLNSTTDLLGASFVEEFKDHLFFTKDDLVSHSAPFDEDDFTPANGASSYRLPSDCTGLITFRDQLINFSLTDIKRLQGTSSADFTLTDITKELGCVQTDTIQEVGGDILFLGPDGVRFLGATERIGDFNLSLASRQIQENFRDFVTGGDSFCTLTIREKNQYRIFGYRQSDIKLSSTGYIGAQFLDQSGQAINWGLTKGIKAYRASSVYTGSEEVVLFTNDDDYVYIMESGNDFDGVDIEAALYTPFMSVNDPTIRKTAYKVDTYFDPEGLVAGTLTLKYDFVKPTKIQPSSVVIDGGGNFAFYGTAIYGTSSYGGVPDTTIESMVVGSFFTVSVQYEFIGGPPFVLDTVILEYSTEDRK